MGRVGCHPLVQLFTAVWLVMALVFLGVFASHISGAHPIPAAWILAPIGMALWGLGLATVATKVGLRDRDILVDWLTDKLAP